MSTDNRLSVKNNEDGSDTIKDVQNHSLEMGLDPNKLDAINFQEKSYAFLRPWIDDNVPLNIIIAVIRHMVQNRLYTSFDIPEDVLRELISNRVRVPRHPAHETERIMDLDPIVIPDIDLSLLQQFSNAYISGGARHECLKEITIMMNAFNIKYTLVKDFIY